LLVAARIFAEMFRWWIPAIHAMILSCVGSKNQLALGQIALSMIENETSLNRYQTQAAQRMLNFLDIPSWSIKNKLFLFLLLLFLLVSGIIIGSGVERRSHDIEDARKGVLLLVESLASQQEQMLSGTRQMLSTLAHLPQVQTLDTSACNRIFHELHDKYPFYSMISAATPDGNVYARSPVVESGSINVAERKHIRDALSSLDFSAGEYAVEKQRGIDTIHYSYPVLDESGKLVAILVAGFNVNEYAHLIEATILPEDANVILVDHKGIRLYRFPANKKAPVGEPFVRRAFGEISGREHRGVSETTAADGSFRIYAYKQLRLRENLPPYMYIVVSVPKAPLIEKANRRMLGSFMLLGIIVITAGALALVFGIRFLTIPLSQLVRATRELSAGKLGGRTGLPHTTDELGQLAASFDEMAQQLEIRSIERDKAEGERQKYEQRLQKAEKAESLARMAGAIAHNFNNLLGAVIGNLELALADVTQNSNLEDFITEAVKASNKAAEISRLMLVYLGQTTGKARPIDPSNAVKEALSLLGASLRDNICLKTDFSSPGSLVEANEAHLTQILHRVLSNAVEAIGEREGEIILDMDVVYRDAVENATLSSLGWKAKAEKYVCISIADTGCGIEAENLDRIFDPFFSTKFTGRGLGLAVVSGLLRTMDGAISADSRPGAGTTFTLYLPII
jgi:signal transduction histidine kinase